MQQQSVTAIIDPWTKVGRVVLSDNNVINKQYLVFVAGGTLHKRPISTGTYSAIYETCKCIMFKGKQYYIDVTAVPMPLVGLTPEALQVL